MRESSYNYRVNENKTNKKFNEKQRKHKEDNDKYLNDILIRGKIKYIINKNKENNLKYMENESNKRHNKDEEKREIKNKDNRYILMKIKYISEKNKKWNNKWKQIIEKQKRYKELDYKYKKQLELYEKKKECREIQELHNLYTKYIKELNNKPALILERKMENIITRVNHNLTKLNQKYKVK